MLGRLALGALCAWLLAAALTAAAPAAKGVCTRTAATDGSQRYRSVAQLLDALKPGETGCLAPGVYEETVSIARAGAPGKPVTLRSVPGTRATIRGGFYVSRTASDLVVSYLRLDGAAAGGRPSPQINGARITFRYDDVTNRHTGICFIIGGEFERYGVATNTVIDHNRIHGCGRLPATNHDHAVYVEGSTAARITNNVIFDISDWGIHLYPEADRTLVSHNTIVRTGGGIIVAGEAADGEYSTGHASDHNTITLNVLAFQRGHALETYWGGPEGVGNLAVRNCVWRPGESALGDIGGLSVTGTVVADPRFASLARNDFRIGRASRCAAIGAGPVR